MADDLQSIEMLHLITKGKQPVIYPYHMEGQVLESVKQQPLS